MKKVLFNDAWTFSSDIDPTPHPVRLPHDAMQTEKRIPVLCNGSGTGYYPGGVYTYTKEILVSGEELDKTAILEFEGVYMNASVYLNDAQIGGCVYGYTDFYVNLTGKLREGRNELKVIADNSRFPNSRWYSGSGIYRDVVLHSAGKEYIKPDGVKISTISIRPAAIRVDVDAVRNSDTKILVSIKKDGQIVSSGEGETSTLNIPDAKLWSAETPELYQAEVLLMKDGEIADRAEEEFGIRSLACDAEKGFQVNGKTVKLRGGCVHHDHGVIGAAEYEEACLRRVRIMKEAGFNAVRISHHPASRAMLRACDRLGMYVMNESFDTWLGLKNPYDYAMYFKECCQDDLAAMIRVSFNHPSVVMYSIGNEVYLKDIQKATEITEALVHTCHTLDSSRPVINALNPLMVTMDNSKNPEQNRNAAVNPRAESEPSKLAGSQLANTLMTLLPFIMKSVGNEKAMRKRRAVLDPLDIVGFNYGRHLYSAQHKDYPKRVLCGSETFPSQIAQNWDAVEKMPWVIGDFLWTAWDYLGEAGVGTVGYGKAESFTQPYPCIQAGIGNIDLTGEINCQGHYTATVYGQRKKPYIAVHPMEHFGEKVFLGQWRTTDALHSWTWHGFDGKKAAVDVYANAAQVELFKDGVSLGKKAVKNCIASYKVTYCPGVLKAISYDANGRELGTDILRSAGEDIHMNVSPENTGADLIYLPVELVDNNGIRQIRMDRELTVKVEGAAELIGLGSAAQKQDSLTPYTGDHTKSFEGRALAVLRRTGENGNIHVTVSADGVDSVQLKL